MEKKYDVVIIGGGPAGYSAALYCTRAGLSTLVLEMLSAGGQMATTTQVENYPGFNEGIDGFDLAEKMLAGAERFGAVSEFAEVTALHLAENSKRIVTSDGEVLARAVILATGAVPKKLGLPGEDDLVGRGVAYCATCDGMYFKGKTVAVAGGGNSAAEDAKTLSHICKKVYLIHRRDTLRAEKAYLDPLENADNLEFIWNTQIDELLTDGKLTGLALTDRVTGTHRSLSCDGLFVAIGRDPNTALVKNQVELDAQGYIVADETTRTSVPGVFAAGDVRTKPLRQIVTAAADGAVASKYVQEFLQTH
ncbi:Thioredoxin reductase [anaerobic digester metagenome]|uniref:thioredoxin-disulfide reductase n=1 Tax=Oscillibacter ruminantium TaxID=1263547 RepID=UPI0002FE1200|nr:thioredoxin-disulfide reductase [Oscillibacter ruminantium]